MRQLQYVLAVAEELSFRRAAERCHVSQPSLSAQLAQLEEVLGVRVFERDQRRVLLTAVGRDIVARAQRVLLAADDLAESARRAGDPFAGSLRVGVIPTVSPYLLPCVTPRVRAKFPRLTLVWVEEKTESLMRALHAGELDAALVALEADIGDVESEVVAIDPFVLVTSPDHPLAKSSAPATRKELRDANVLLLDEGHCFREQALDFCSTARTNELEFRATSLPTLVQMVAGGSAVTLLPVLSVPTETARSNLIVRQFAPPAPKRTIALVWRKSSPLGASLKQLAATIREAYPEPMSAKSRR